MINNEIKNELNDVPIETNENPAPTEGTRLGWKGIGHALRFTLYMSSALVALAAIVQFVALPAITLAASLSATGTPFTVALFALGASFAIYLSLLALVATIIKLAEMAGVHNAAALVNEQAKYQCKYAQRG